MKADEVLTSVLWKGHPLSFAATDGGNESNNNGVLLDVFRRTVKVATAEGFGGAK
jgi:hypothetical protein